MRRSRSICRPRSAARCCFIPARGGASPAVRAGDQRIAQHPPDITGRLARQPLRSEEHTSELQSRFDLVCRLLLEKKKTHFSTVRCKNRLLSTSRVPTAADKD